MRPSVAAIRFIQVSIVSWMERNVERLARSFLRWTEGGDGDCSSEMSCFKKMVQLVDFREYLWYNYFMYLWVSESGAFK